MAKKRWLLLGSLVVSCAVAVIVTLALLPPRPGVTKANFARIQDGMSCAEVEAILGGPPCGFAYFDADGRRYSFWTSYDAVIVTGFKNDRVVSRECRAGWPDSRTTWQKLVALVTGRQDEPDFGVEIGLQDPAPYYTNHAPLYFPPPPLPKDLHSLEEAQRRFDEEAKSVER